MKALSENSLDDMVEFAENPDPRCQCVIVVDISGSMAGPPIEHLNQGLRDFKKDLEQDDLASKRVDICIVSFSDVVRVEQDFVTVDNFMPPTLSAGGGTSLGAGVEHSLDMIENRNAVYRANGVACYRPWLFLITDGAPTDSVSRATQRIREAETMKQAACFAVGVEGADMNRLAEIFVRPPIKLNGLDFKSLFLWLSYSMAKVADSRVCDQIALPPVNWGKV